MKPKAKRSGIVAERLSTALLIPDCHHPNVDPKAWGLVLRAAAELQPDTVVVLGDFLDGESVSLHEPDEVGGVDLEAELESVNAALDQLDAIGASTRVYLEGNHEQRLSRYIARKAPALWRTMRLPDLLRLKERGWQWVPYRTSYRLGRVHLTHDTGSAGLNAHRSSAKAFMGSAVIGHTHRMAYEVTGRFQGKPYLGAMLGWLGDAKKAARYIHEAKSAEWVHGFGFAVLDADGYVHLQPVPIVGGRACVAGLLVD